jgi:secreted PhoX family phosphatase
MATRTPPAPAPTFGVDFWRAALEAPAIIGIGPYGPLGPADIYGVCLPAGFRARLVGRTSRAVAGTDYTWHPEPDGAATLRMRDGGWAYVSNADLPAQQAGAGAIRFNAEGRIVDAYRVLDGTTDNRTGCPTPWGTWLSCEAHARGRVWECDAAKPGQGTVRPELGAFAHGSVAVDPRSGWVYLTERGHEGRIHRFRPGAYGDLSMGALEAAKVRRSGHVDWVEVSAKYPERSAATSGFAHVGPGWFADGHLFLTSAGDQRVWTLDVASNCMDVIYEAASIGADAPLHEFTSITLHERSGDIYVAEDGADTQLMLLADAGRRRVAAPFLRLDGHPAGEIVGTAFTPDGTRMLFSSKHGVDGEGLTFDVTGPFRKMR